MFAKTIEALKAVEAAAQEELSALWVPHDPATGTGAVYWNAQGAGALQEALGAVSLIRAGLEPTQAAHDAAQAAATVAEAAPVAETPEVTESA